MNDFLREKIILKWEKTRKIQPAKSFLMNFQWEKSAAKFPPPKEIPLFLGIHLLNSPTHQKINLKTFAWAIFLTQQVFSVKLCRWNVKIGLICVSVRESRHCGKVLRNMSLNIQ